MSCRSSCDREGAGRGGFLSHSQPGSLSPLLCSLYPTIQTVLAVQTFPTLNILFLLCNIGCREELRRWRVARVVNLSPGRRYEGVDRLVTTGRTGERRTQRPISQLYRGSTWRRKWTQLIVTFDYNLGYRQDPGLILLARGSEPRYHHIQPRPGNTAVM